MNSRIGNGSNKHTQFFSIIYFQLQLNITNQINLNLIFLKQHKSESFEKFKEFKNEVQNQLGKNIKTF